MLETARANLARRRYRRLTQRLAFSIVLRSMVRRARAAKGRINNGRRSFGLAFVCAALLLLFAGAARADSPRLFDWDALTREATDLLSNYIQINTSNPPGNELAAAKMLKETFLRDGIPAAVFEAAPGRGIIAARLRGVGKQRKALILLSHMDVVPADAQEWSVPPFS